MFRLFGVLRLDLWIIAGNEISSGRKLSIIFAGHEVNRNYIEQLAFNDPCRQKYVGKKWLWKIPEAVKQNGNGCALAITEAPKFFRVLSKKRKCLYVPIWINGAIDIPSYIKADNYKKDLRRIRKNKLHVEVTKDLSQIHDFYHNMYVPYIATAHGSRAIITSYNSMKREFKKRNSSNELFLIKKDRDLIAGIVLLRTKDRARFWCRGVKDGNLDYLKYGVSGALYYFVAQYLEAKGFKMIGCGGSRSFLKDGVLQFKKHRGMRIVNSSDMDFLVEPLSMTSGLMGFLSNNPVTYRDKNKLNGALFVASDQHICSEDYTKIYKEYFLHGLSKLVIYRFGEADKKMADIVPPEYSDKITVCSAGDIF
ncbi:hypothetical protein ACFL3Q_00425 [Planctomycetota bacterium]